MHWLRLCLIAAVLASATAYRCEWRYTKTTRRARGHLGPLLLHNVELDCGKRELRGFQLLNRYRVGWVQMRYKYNCCYYGKKVCNSAYSSTKYTTVGKRRYGATEYLSRQRPKCGGHTSAFKSLKLTRAGHRIRYNFKCCTYKRPFVYCKSKKNAWTVGKESISYLDRQSVLCGPKEVLKGFSLKVRRTRPMRFQYRYTCCKPHS